jgi:hypothetical protein
MPFYAMPCQPRVNSGELRTLTPAPRHTRHVMHACVRAQGLCVEEVSLASFLPPELVASGGLEGIELAHAHLRLLTGEPAVSILESVHID